MSQKRVAGGFIMEGSVRLTGVNYQKEISSDVFRIEEAKASSLKLSHQRELTQIRAGEVDISFLMNKEEKTLPDVLQIIDGLGHQPAVLPEVEHLRLLARSQKRDLFAMADEHAERRKGKFTVLDQICLPVFGSSFCDRENGQEIIFVPALVLDRLYGSDRYVLLRPEESVNIYPAWMIPVVCKN